jgi:hypothetical protein
MEFQVSQHCRQDDGVFCFALNHAIDAKSAK